MINPEAALDEEYGEDGFNLLLILKRFSPLLTEPNTSSVEKYINLKSLFLFNLWYLLKASNKATVGSILD